MDIQLLRQKERAGFWLPSGDHDAYPFVRIDAPALGGMKEVLVDTGNPFSIVVPTDEIEDPLGVLPLLIANNLNFSVDFDIQTMAGDTLSFRNVRVQFGAPGSPIILGSQDQVFTGVQYLDISCTDVTDVAPLYNLPKLKTVKISGDQFDSSEETALDSLDGDTHLLAHSMGNVVAAEALRLWSTESEQALVKNFVALEAAISAGLFGDNNRDAFDISGASQGVDLAWPHEIHSESNVDLNRAWANGDVDVSDPTTAYMQGTKSAASKWVNLYNPDDVATSLAWKANNLLKFIVNQEDLELPDLPGAGDEITYDALFDYGFGFFDGVDDNELWRLLPPPEIWSWRYVVRFNVDLGQFEYFRLEHDIAEELDIPEEDWIPLTDGLVTSNGLPDVHAYEIIAFMSQANAAPVGTKHVPWFDTNTNFFAESAGIVDPDFISGADWSSHSFQFHHDASATWKFWEHVKQQTTTGGEGGFRHQRLVEVETKPFVTVMQDLPQEQYYREFAARRFVLSPRGNGIDCHRTYEALIHGAIPIVAGHDEPLREKYAGLPVLFCNDYAGLDESGAPFGRALRRRPSDAG